MKNLTIVASLALALVVGFLGQSLAAEEVTLNGTIMCAKCKLKKPDAKECQDVLITKDDAGAATEYYVAKTDVSKEFGHNCTGEVPATVTGEVTEKEGRKWITPSKMEKTS
jgi:hypothetical protein